MLKNFTLVRTHCKYTSSHSDVFLRKGVLKTCRKSCSQCFGDSRLWGSLTVVPAGNRAKRFSSVNHTTKTIHHHHQHPCRSYLASLLKSHFGMGVPVNLLYIFRTSLSKNTSGGCFCKYLLRTHPKVFLQRASMSPNWIFTIKISTNQKTVVRRCSVKQAFLEISQNWQETSALESHYWWSCKTCNLIKKQTPTQVFLWVLGNFERHPFLRNSYGDCFSNQKRNWLMNTTCCQKSQKLATTIPVHLFAIRGRRNYFLKKIALGTRLRNWSYLMNNDWFGGWLIRGTA